MIKKIFVPILQICKSKFIKIQDPRFANREAEQIGTKLVSSFDRMPNKSWERDRLESELAEERRRQIRANQGVPQPGQFSESTIPSEEEILGPSDSALKKEEK